MKRDIITVARIILVSNSTTCCFMSLTPAPGSIKHDFLEASQEARKLAVKNPKKRTIDSIPPPPQLTKKPQLQQAVITPHATPIFYQSTTTTTTTATTTATTTTDNEQQAITSDRVPPPQATDSAPASRGHIVVTSCNPCKFKIASLDPSEVIFRIRIVLQLSCTMQK